MRIVVTGRDGQVVRSLIERGAAHRQTIVPIGRPELDLTAERGAIIAAIEGARPDVIVSAAAYTAVDKAEAEPKVAFAINECGAASVAQAAKRCGVPLIHLSTDYVFDGRKEQPYVEQDATSPTGVYGASKLAGEQAVLAEHGDVAILRTAWVYSPFGSNFVRTMLRLADNREEVRVVADQRGNPTSALDIAEGVLAVARNLTDTRDPGQRGIFHLAAAGEATWAEFAERIFATSTELGGPAAKVTHIGTEDYPTPAKRPANSRLDCTKLAETHAVCLPEWRESTKDVVARLLRPSA